MVDGSKRMRERPIAEGVELLRQLGAKIEYVEAEGRLPVRVTPSDKFVGGEIEVGQTQSSQFISALMLISPFLGQPLRLCLSAAATSESYVDLTGQVMADWGGAVGREVYERDDALTLHHMGKTILCVPRQISGCKYSVEPDASSAVYWAVAAALVSKACVYLNGLTYRCIQPDTEIIEVLGIAGARHGEDREKRRFVRGRGTLDQVSADASGFPDGAMAMAVAAARAERPSRITGLRTLRVKETDRIAALANELRKVGCTVETGEDWIEITPAPARAITSTPPAEPGAKGERSDPIIIETYNDHRMAMAFAVLGLAALNGRRLAIRNPACVAKSYPTFWRDFAKLYG